MFSRLGVPGMRERGIKGKRTRDGIRRGEPSLITPQRLSLSNGSIGRRNPQVFLHPGNSRCVMSLGLRNVILHVTGLYHEVWCTRGASSSLSVLNSCLSNALQFNTSSSKFILLAPHTSDCFYFALRDLQVPFSLASRFSECFPVLTNDL